MMENAPLLHTTLSEYYTTEVKRVAGQLTSLAPARLAGCLGPGDRRMESVSQEPRNIASCRLRIGRVSVCLEMNTCTWETMRIHCGIYLLKK